MTVPRIGIALGDPGGIGPEIALKALSRLSSLPEARYIIYGDRFVLTGARENLGLRLGISPWTSGDPPAGPGLSLREAGFSPEGIVPGRASKENGMISFLYFERAIEEARKGLLQAVVTAPVSKTSWRLAGVRWRGHTDYLESLYPGAIMTFWSDRLKVILLSHHLPLREALSRVRKDILLDFFRTLRESLSRIRSGILELLVAGLNPHAGEGGLLGVEDEKEIKPAIEQARHEGMNISGPISPDTVFLRAVGHPDKAVIALYHDQGLIGFKLEAFDRGVNATLGMPFIRTSPDHGTAFDIAGKNVADPRSMIEAIKLAVRLS